MNTYALLQHLLTQFIPDALSHSSPWQLFKSVCCESDKATCRVAIMTWKGTGKPFSMTSVFSKFKICNYWHYVILPSDTHFNIMYVFIRLYGPLRQIIKTSHNANLHRIKKSIVPFLWTFLLQSMIPVILGHTPAGTSTKTLIHFAQLVKSGKKFCCF